MTIARGAFALAGGELGSRIPLVALELCLASLLGPASYGLWAVVQSVIAYGGFLQFGVVSSLARREPGLTVLGSHTELTTLRGAAYGFQIAVVATAMVGSAVWAALTGATVLGVPAVYLPLIFLTVFLQQIQLTAQTSALNQRAFVSVARSRMIYAVCFLACGLAAGMTPRPLPWLVGAWGLSTAVATVLLFVAVPGIRAWPRVSVRHSLSLLRDGFPIFVQGLAKLVLSSLDRLIIWLAMAGTAMLGIYALGQLAGALCALIPSILSRVMLPFFLSRRQEGASAEQQTVMLDTISKYAVLTTFMAAIGVALMAPVVVRLWLPAYASGLWIITGLTAAGALLGTAQFAADVAMAAGTRHQVLMITLGSLMALAMALPVVVRASGGLGATVAVVLVVFAIHWIALTAVCYRTLGLPWGEAARRTVRAFLPIPPLVGAAFAATLLQLSLMNRFDGHGITQMGITLACAALIGAIVAARSRHFLEADRA